MEPHVLKLGSRPLASKTNKRKGKVATVITEVQRNQICEWCPRCGHEYTFAKYAKHPCEKVLVRMKSCFVKLDHLNVSQKSKSRLQVNVEPKSNDVVMVEIEGNNTCENNYYYCSRCGTKYKSLVEYTKHPCEKILAGMQACVVQLDCFTLPSDASPESRNSVSSASLSKPSVCTIT